jgi:DNA-binding Lrp family transcriptional regulator
MWKGKGRKIYQKTKKAPPPKTQAGAETVREPMKAKTTAFMLMSTSPKKTGSVRDELCKIPEVTERYILFGDYDIMVKIQAEDTDEIKVVIDKIASIEGIIVTKDLQTTSV